ncbi:MAG: hypothetical protein EPN53_16765 [Acidobacteria bacterium]|nr:MAG: hypothetical protein EPN53_16765 [Acidobacteriota bacterium]
MPRATAKPRHGVQGQPVRLVKLSDDAQRELCGLVGLRFDRPLEREPSGPLTPEQARAWRAAHDTMAERMLREVSDLLGLWPGLEEELDQAPSPKECAAALRPVEQHAEALRLALEALDSSSRRLLERPLTRISDRTPADPLLAFAFDLDRFRGDLSVVRARAGGAVRAAAAGAHHAERSPHLALEFMAQQLAKVFASFYAHEHERLAVCSRTLPDGRIVRVPVLTDPFGSGHPERRLAFVRRALAAGRIRMEAFMLERYLTKLDEAQEAYLDSLDG